MSEPDPPGPGEASALEAAIAALSEAEPRFAAALDLCGPLPDRGKPEGFATLFQAIVSQQISLAAAAAIWGRAEAAGLVTPEAVLAAPDQVLIDVGLTRAKQRYIRGIAAAKLDYAGLRAMEDEAAIAALVALPGIGRWTAEIYVMFSLGRMDVMAGGDIALQEGAKRLFGLPERPSEAQLRTLAEAWRPWRSVAARILWAYYAHSKGKEGIW